MTVVSETLHKSWSLQRILNRYPIWSRARTRDDSVAHYILNPFGAYFDEVLETLIDMKRDYYIDKVDLLEEPFMWTVDLPRTFAFVETGNVQGIPIYEPPTVIGMIDTDSISITVAEHPVLQEIDKSQVVPTRISGSRIISGFNNIVIPETSIIDLSLVSLNDDFVNDFGYLYVEIDNATQFGEVLNTGTTIVPKVIIKGTPWIYDDEQEEHMSFRANGERRSSDRWKDITSIETHGIYDENTTIKVHTGFDKRAVREPNGFWEDEIRETILLYTYENSEFDGSILPTIQFKVPELTDPTLRQRGFGVDTLEYEFGIMLDQDTFLDEELVAIERMPFTKWFLLATATNLHVVSARMPHIFNWIHEDDNGMNVVSEGIKSRSLGPELNILADRNWTNYTEDGTQIRIETRHTKPVRGIRSTRLSITYDSPAMSQPVTTYYDWDGSEIDINTHISRGFIFNSHSDADPTDWNEKFLILDIADIVEHPAWVAVVKLEAKMSDNETETDVYVIHSDIRIVDKTLAWPDAIQGKVNGITYDAQGRLLARTTDDEVWSIDMFWDYCLIDYKIGTVFLREEYDTVEVTS